MSAEGTASSSLSGDSRRRSSKSKTVCASTSGGFSGASREIRSWRNYGEQKGHRKRGRGESQSRERQEEIGSHPHCSPVYELQSGEIETLLNSEQHHPCWEKKELWTAT